MATVFERVRAIVVEELDIDENEVVPKANFRNDLNADSLDLVELIMNLEEAFSGADQINVSDEEAEKLQTVQDVLDFLKAHGIEDE